MPTTKWLQENGPGELEQLFRAIVSNLSAAILLTDNDRRGKEASEGVGKLLGLPREQIIGHSLDDFAEPGFRVQISELWDDFLLRGVEQGWLRLMGPDGVPKEVAFIAKEGILPSRNLLMLKDKTGRMQEDTPSGVRDFALFLLNPLGMIAAWYGGAEHIYGYSAEEATKQNISLLYPAGDRLTARLGGELRRAAEDGHSGDECWGMKKDRSRFWANVITTPLRNAKGELQGYARVVRDFSERRVRDEKLRSSRSRLRVPAVETAIAGLVSGEYDQIPEVNDTLLNLIGYTRGDLQNGQLHWADLTPPEFFALDDLAHEEGLRFGACTPYEKNLIRKDGTQIPVLVTTAILNLTPFRWTSVVQDLSELPEAETAGDGVEPRHVFEEIVGRGSAIRRMLGLIELVSPTNSTVLIQGETGTGKELVARALHRVSPRRDRPFVTLNCAAIPTGLLESELFGYERGAFTGALTQKIGRFELANHGTLFLDEVGDIPLELQPKLLRALQEKAFERLGGTKTFPIDVRLVAATNRNLTEMMAEKLFRPDLYYRLKVFPIATPPLRDHAEDIPALVRHFVKQYSAEMNRTVDTVAPDTMRALVSWPWPGNIRELENFVERSVILSTGNTLLAPLSELRLEELEQSPESTLNYVEREHILKILRECEGGVTKAAIRLGTPRTTLNALMRKLGIERKNL